MARLARAILLISVLSFCVCEFPETVVVLGQEAQPPAQPGTSSPPEPVWLRDSRGREYYVEKIPKNQAKRIDGNRVQTIWGVSIEIVNEDADFFYFKYYKAGRKTGIVIRDEAVTAEKAAALAAEYRSNIRSSDRLSFIPFDLGLPHQGQWRDGFAVADMNEDGHPDLIFGPPRKSLGGPVIFLGDGTGSWTRWKDARFPPLPYDYGAAAVGDLNGDGHMDIVFGVHLRGLIALLGDGKGNFVDHSNGLEFAMPGRDQNVAFSSRALAIFDWNGDGRPDIVALGEGPRLDLTSEKRGIRSQSVGLLVYLNEGEAGWKRLDLASGPGANFGDSIVVTDLNHDGRPDVVTGSMMMGRRDILHVSDANHTASTRDLDLLRPNALIRSVAAADFNGDGTMDLAVAYTAYEQGQWRSGVDVLYQMEEGRWSRETLVSVDGIGGPMVVATGDLDGDGRPDIAVGTAEGEIWPFLGGHGVTFSRESTLTPSFGNCTVTALLLRDLNGDGRPEILASFANETASDDARKCPGQGGIAIWTSRPSRSPTIDVAPDR